MNQHDFIRACKVKYEKTLLPEGECWEDAHYPVPSCKNGQETVLLWARDHSLHGVLQSEDLGHPCLHHASESRDRENISTYYPEYLPLYEKWLKKLRSLGGKASILAHGGCIPNNEYRPEHQNGGNIKKVHERRKLDPEFDEYIVAHCRVNGARGGSVSGPLNKGFKWCNNGIREKKYREEVGLPVGYLPGRLPGKNGHGKPVKEDG